MEEEVEVFLNMIKQHCKNVQAQEKKLFRPLRPDELSDMKSRYFSGLHLKVRLGDLIELSKAYCVKTGAKFYFSNNGTSVQFMYCPQNGENFSQVINISSLLKKNMPPVEELKINLVDFLLTRSNTSRTFCRYSNSSFRPLDLEKVFIKYYLDHRYEIARADLKPQIDKINKQIQVLEKQKSKLEAELDGLKPKECEK